MIRFEAPAQLAAGTYHSVAAEDNGAVTEWGAFWADIPVDLTNAVAVVAGYGHSLALRSDGTVAAWGASWTEANYVPAGLTGVKAVAAAWDHNVALLANGTVVAWGYDGSGETDVPNGLSNVVAVAAGGQHNLALKADGTVVAWGYNGSGQRTVPAGLSNVLAIAAGEMHSVALKNDGSMISWGDNTVGQTNTPTSGRAKLIAAGGYHTMAAMFSSYVQYPVDVSKDLLLIYNTNSAGSSNVFNYYLQHRPMVSGANVLPLGCSADETVDGVTFANDILIPYLNWLTNNPTKHPQYLVLFMDIPSRVDNPANSASVQYQLSTNTTGIQPFVTSINMNGVNGTNDCIAYINKLAYIGTNYSPGKPLLSASPSGRYANTNYYFDDTAIDRYDPPSQPSNKGLSASNGVFQAGVSPAAIIYTNVPGDITPSGHITKGTNVAGYFSWGVYGYSGNTNRTYATNGSVVFNGDSGWYIIETIESNNGLRGDPGQGNFIEWFASNAFGGANYANTPVGAVTHVEEPQLSGCEDPQTYFGLWARGKNFAICAWNARQTPYFQAVGDPLTSR